MEQVDTPSAAQEGATALITHRVQEGKEKSYEQWLDDVASACQSYTGYLDMHVIKPVPGVTETHSIMLRFDTQKHLDQWMESDACQSLVGKVQPILGQNEDIYIKSGLDFWFTPKGAKAQLPNCWKQFLVTWAAIFPVTLGFELLVSPLLSFLKIPNNLYINTFIVTGLSVWAMVYVVMPRVTRLVQNWLFDEQG